MRGRLPKSVFESIQMTIDKGARLDSSIADSVASAMRDWAQENGASHYAHVFYPLTGLTAEKHDSFLEPDNNGSSLAQFTGKTLLQGEPDASSFPNGGIRGTFEARCYTAWDVTSPAYILENPNGNTLCIPTIFVSWTGEALDKKTPLLRSQQAMGVQAARVLKLFGHTDVDTVVSYAGAEQEYFLIDENFFVARPDLMSAGRTLFGAKPAKGQQFDDHYFGAIPERVLAYMIEVDRELFKQGILAKTRHNEVAPGQFEIAPLFEKANLAHDHQQLMMTTLRKVAERYGMTCLLHEKPFAGVNGSGKHVNFSLGNSAQGNLLNPGDTPHENAQFLIFCAATVRAVHKYAGLLRLSVCGAGNDHRLGANEAPPAIISVFLGEQLSDVFAQLVKGGAKNSKSAESIEIGVSMLPQLPRDTGDRNRTSPFAFTGNKFEFRAVGSSQSVAGPNTVLNAIVAESLDFFATSLEKSVAAGEDLNSAVQKLLAKSIKEFKPILFDGDNYSDGWMAEAKKRGLPNLVSTIDCVPLATAKESIVLFTKYGVYSERELESRHEILLENYTTTISIEALTTSLMAHTMILPAGLKYQSTVADAVNGAKQAGASDPAQTDMLKEIVKLNGSFRKAAVALDKVIAAEPKGGALTYAKHMHDKVLPAMNKLRALGDRIEQVVDDSMWPLPTYREMLFIR